MSIGSFDPFLYMDFVIIAMGPSIFTWKMTRRTHILAENAHGCCMPPIYIIITCYKHYLHVNISTSHYFSQLHLHQYSYLFYYCAAPILLLIIFTLFQTKKDLYAKEIY